MTDEFVGRDFVRTLTQRPGVYRMLAADGTVLYVGKARNLKRRVGSYFSRRALDAKTQTLMQSVARVEVTVTATEQEALLLEYNLIKEYKPRFNVLLRDDKSYPYIHVTTQQQFPRIEVYRGSRHGPGRILGPFPDAGAVREMMHQLQKLFRVRQCTDSFFANRSRPCLQYQIHRCSGPCAGLIDAADYRRSVDDAIRFIEGKDEAVISDLVTRMEHSAEELDFERAAQYRDLIGDIRSIQERQAVSAHDTVDLDAVEVAVGPGQACVTVLMIRGGRMLGTRSFFPRVATGTEQTEVLAAFLLQHYMVHPAPREIIVRSALADAESLALGLGGVAGHAVAIRRGIRGDRRRWLEMARENARQALAARSSATATRAAQSGALAEALGVEGPLSRIECFDVSHTQGGETVASCVVFGETGPRKADYRRFNIQGVEAGDDYGAMAQAIERRYVRVARGEGIRPDLLMVDGGRGQLARTVEVLVGLGLGGIPVLAIAKGADRKAGLEQLYVGAAATPLALATDSPAQLLIRTIRDEAHRFAITGHRQRRGRSQSRSVLEEIPGLGPQRRRALLQRFGGIQGISRAGVEDLMRTTGISRNLADRIYRQFHEVSDENS